MPSLPWPALHSEFPALLCCPLSPLPEPSPSCPPPLDLGRLAYCVRMFSVCLCRCASVCTACTEHALRVDTFCECPSVWCSGQLMACARTHTCLGCKHCYTRLSPAFRGDSNSGLWTPGGPFLRLHSFPISSPWTLSLPLPSLPQEGRLAFLPAQPHPPGDTPHMIGSPVL